MKTGGSLEDGGGNRGGESGLVSILLAEIKGLADGFIVEEGKGEAGF